MYSSNSTAPLCPQLHTNPRIYARVKGRYARLYFYIKAYTHICMHLHIYVDIYAYMWAPNLLSTHISSMQEFTHVCKHIRIYALI